MSSPKVILVTGGAGYVGSVLTRKLVEQDFHVKIIDSLVYGADGISKYLSDGSIEFLNSDIREIDKIKNFFNCVDCVIHLAAIVGEPLCQKIPLAAKQINEFATKNLVLRVSWLIHFQHNQRHQLQELPLVMTCLNSKSCLFIVC